MDKVLFRRYIPGDEKKLSGPYLYQDEYTEMGLKNIGVLSTLYPFFTGYVEKDDGIEVVFIAGMVKKHGFTAEISCVIPKSSLRYMDLPRGMRSVFQYAKDQGFFLRMETRYPLYDYKLQRWGRFIGLEPEGIQRKAGDHGEDVMVYAWAGGQ